MVDGDNNRSSVGGSTEVATAETAAMVAAAVASAMAAVAELMTTRG